jgi:hypothetical protein
MTRGGPRWILGGPRGLASLGMTEGGASLAVYCGSCGTVVSVDSETAVLPLPLLFALCRNVSESAADKHSCTGRLCSGYLCM